MSRSCISIFIQLNSSRCETVTKQTNRQRLFICLPIYLQANIYIHTSMSALINTHTTGLKNDTQYERKVPEVYKFDFEPQVSNGNSKTRTNCSEMHRHRQRNNAKATGNAPRLELHPFRVKFIHT